MFEKMEFLIIFALFGLLLLQVECQDVKGYRDSPAAQSRLFSGKKAMKADRGIADREEAEREEADREEVGRRIVDREVGGREEAETAVMKLVLNGQSDSDIGFDHEEFHRDQHIKACLGAVDDSQIQKKLKQRTVQSDVKSRFSEGRRFSETDRGSGYRSGSPARYQVVATSRSSAIIGPQQGIRSGSQQSTKSGSQQGIRRRISSSEGQQVTRRRRIQVKRLEEGPSGQFEQCLEVRKVGPCRGSMSRYWYNPTNGICEEFFYGGCKGNRNNFLTSDDCMETCFARGSRRVILQPLQDSITHKAGKQRGRIQGVKGGYTSSLFDRSSRRGSGLESERMIELESGDLIADEVLPFTSTTAGSSTSAHPTETIPRSRFSAQVEI